MSSLAFLVTELQSLSSETRRRHPEVREAAEKSLAILRSSPDQAINHLASDGPQSEDLLRPVFMGCATKNAKVINISLGSLQRLIALQAVPQSVVPKIITVMNDCMAQGVDIQLRILQILVYLITNFPSIHGALLGDALILCFKLQESRIAVVSSTAAATLRQLVMVIVEKVVDEDRRDDMDSSMLTATTLPDGSRRQLGPSAHDAYSIIEDLCLLANSEKPNFLMLGSLPKTFALELIESVLTNHYELFRKHVELLSLLRHHLCPLLLKLLSDKAVFPQTLRSTRVVFLLLKQFSEELVTETEVFLSLLIRIVGGDSDPSDKRTSNSLPAVGSRPQWMRVLAMEIIRGLCNDAELMRQIWEKFDSQPSNSNLFSSLITVLKRLVTEKPALLGVSTQMFGVGVSANPAEAVHTSSSSSGHGFDVGTVASMVANAATATVTGVVGMMGSESGGLSLTGSAMKLQCIDQLDKADAPPIPDTYIYLLGLQCLVSICEGFASLTLPLYNSIVVQRPRAPGEASIRAPPALDLSILPPEQESTKQLNIVHDMINAGWPGLLAALSFLIATNISDELFGDVLQSYQNMTNVAGMLGLITPRDAFLTSLAKFAIPARVVSSIDTYVEPPTPRTATGTISDNLGLTALSGASATQAPGLSDRNLACLKVMVSSALFLGGSLGASWYSVLETLQNAEYVLTARGTKFSPAKRSSSGPVQAVSKQATGTATQPPVNSQQLQPLHPLLVDIDADNLQKYIQRLFDSSKNLDDGAFCDFITALCKLSAEMVEMQSTSRAFPIDPGAYDTESAALSPSQDTVHRRRVSGIHLPPTRTLRAGDFGVNKLGQVSKSNVIRLTHRPPEIAWTPVTRHLLAVLRNSAAPRNIRLQASRTLDDILLIVPRTVSSSEERKGLMQRHVLDVLSEQVAPDPNSGNTNTLVEIRKMGLETLHSILQSSGHTLVVGWETVFEMLGSVCESASTMLSPVVESMDTSPTLSSRKPPVLGYSRTMADKGNAALVRIAFQSLTLVCDTLSTLSPEHLRLCISTLGRFGRQTDTNIALTAAGSLLWGVTDNLQARRKDVQDEAEYGALWMFLLTEVLGLCTDSRSEVRVGAIQTLFRTLQLYGAAFSSDIWEECLWKVTFPLLDTISAIMRDLPMRSSDEAETSGDTKFVVDQNAWDESKVLAFQSVGSLFTDYLTSKIMVLASFERAWDFFSHHFEMAFLNDRPAVGAAALRCLEKGIIAAEQASQDFHDKASVIWRRSWQTCDDMGTSVLQRNQLRHQDSDAMHLLHAFDQESLLALVDVIKCVRRLSRDNERSEWTKEHLSRLMVILKGVLTYSNSPNYRPDVDSVTPVQAAVLDIVSNIDLSTPEAASIVLRDLSEYATLPFIAAFNVLGTYSMDVANAQDHKVPQRITYIALTKKAMPLLLNIFLQFRGTVDIYNDETVESILSAYAIPIKLKYECPAPSKFGNDAPLWKTATRCYLRVVKECMGLMRSSEDAIETARVEGIWGRVVDGFRGGILADCHVTESWPFELQESEEKFDLSLIATLEIDVIPYLGRPRVPDYIITQLAKVLHEGSLLHELDDAKEGARHYDSTHTKDGSESSIQSGSSATHVETVGSTSNGKLVPRERFSYWCLDLLFLVCSDTAKDHENSRRRVAALCLPSLLQRCGMTLLSFLADEVLRGSYPFPRSREEELVYVLRKLLTLHLWPGSLWAAVSSSPTEHANAIPEVDTSLPASKMIADVVRRSSRAHIFHFYNSLCKIASLPNTTPSAWLPSDKRDIQSSSGSSTPLFKWEWDDDLGMSTIVHAASASMLEEHDARTLASACLREIGRELGMA